MQTVTFVKEYRHQLDALRTAVYPAGEFTVASDIVAGARKAGAIKSGRKPRKAKPDGE